MHGEIAALLCAPLGERVVSFLLLIPEKIYAYLFRDKYM